MNTKSPKTDAPLGIDVDDVGLPPAAPKADGLAAQRAAALDALKRNCGNCMCAHFPVPDEESWGECRVRAPRMQIIATPPKVPGLGNGPVYQPLSAWPPVQRSQWCVVDYVPKSSIVQ